MTIVDPARVVVCIPTLNPGRWVSRLVPALAEQRLRPGTILVIDSASTDGSLDRFGEIGAEIIPVARSHFDHGGTRNMALDQADADVVVYLTQDAVPGDAGALGTLVEGLLADERTGVAYGRQLPHPDAGALARAHRAFNYPEHPDYRTAEDVPRLGVRAAFSSNSFAAYRREALESIGGFPSPVVGSEDRWAAARLLQAGWGVAYVPAARVEHSHNYTLRQDFRRYFDIGVFQTSQPWFEDYLGRPEREGARLARRQVEWLRQAGVRFPVLRVVAHAGASWLGFQAGRLHRRLPPRISARWSTAPAYFTSERRSPRGEPGSNVGSGRIGSGAMPRVAPVASLANRARGVVRQHPSLWRTVRALRARARAILPPRTAPGAQGRFHRNDTMLWGRPFSTDVAREYLTGGRETIDLIIERLGATGSEFGGFSTWLEIGCGYGRLVRALVERVDPGQIWALDVDRGGVDFCVSEFGVHGLYGTSDLDYRGLVQADAVVAVSVVSHLDDAGSRRFFTCLGDVVAPGGGVLFTTHGPYSLQSLECYDDGAYGPQRPGLEASFERYGIAYVPYPWAAGAAYGMTWHDPDYVRRAMAEIHGDHFELVLHESCGLDGHQDIWVYRRSVEDDGEAGSTRS